MRTNTRRRPVQQRSAEMVERILAAATRVLENDGYARMSTNRVADEAGVSIGSLYRYFADKDEIFSTLRIRSSEVVTDRLTEAMTRSVGMAPYDGVRNVVATLVDVLREEAAVTRALINEVPLGAHTNTLPEIERRLAQFTRVYAVQRLPDVDEAELDARIYLAMGITLSTCLRIAFEIPGHLDPEHLIDMVAAMLALGLSS